MMAQGKTARVSPRFSYGGARFDEWMADHFAASVLIPPHLLKEEWPKFQDIVQISRHFDVPVGVMLAMLKRVGLIA